MIFFHKHNWKEILRTETPPVKISKAKGSSDNLLERICFGLTTILWECKECQKIRKEEMLGKEVIDS